MRQAVLLTLGALALRLVIGVGHATDEPDDGRLYTRLAHNVVTAGVYSIDEQPPLAPTYIRVPGYPLFIAAIYRTFGDWNDTAVRVAQAVVDTATCWMVALLAAAWCRPPRRQVNPRKWGRPRSARRDGRRWAR